MRTAGRIVASLVVVVIALAVWFVIVLHIVYPGYGLRVWGVVRVADRRLL